MRLEHPRSWGSHTNKNMINESGEIPRPVFTYVGDPKNELKLTCSVVEGTYYAEVVKWIDR